MIHNLIEKHSWVCNNVIQWNSKLSTDPFSCDLISSKEKNQDSVKTRNLTGKTRGRDEKSKQPDVWDIRDKKKCLETRLDRETGLYYDSPGSVPLRMSTAAGLPVQTISYVSSTLRKFKSRVHVENLIGGDHGIATCVSSPTLILAFLLSFRTVLT